MSGKVQATVWKNDGKASFSDSKQRLKYTERHGLAVGDFVGDGDFDVFSAGYDEQFLWLNGGDGRLQVPK